MCLTAFNPSDACCASIPPVPLRGLIGRYVIPSAIPDYAGLTFRGAASVPWSVGNTQAVTRYGPLLDQTVDNDATCYYTHLITPSIRNAHVWQLLAPLRFRFVAPAADGGRYDLIGEPNFGMPYPFPVTTEDDDPETLRYRRGQMIHDERCAIRDRLPPRSWHCQFKDGRGIIENIPGGRDCVPDTKEPTKWREDKLDSIARGVGFWGGQLQPFAIQHRINGQPAGDLVFAPESDGLELIGLISQAGRTFRVRPGDSYELDVWYLHNVYPFADSPTDGPGKNCWYFTLERVTNGSQWFALSTVQPLFFSNVNFSTSLNPQKQTFEISLSGHAGWTLKNGSNGPHPIVTRDGWIGNVSGTGAGFFPSPENQTYLKAIAVDWGSEIPSVYFEPGPLLRSKYPTLPNRILYRSRDSLNLYRQSTVSADYGPIEHAAAGRFDQGGITTFHLVPFTVEGDQFALPGSEYDSNLTNARKPGNTAPRFREIPQAITVRRVNR